MKAKTYSYLTGILIMTNFIVLLCLLKMEDCDEKHNSNDLVVHSDGLDPNVWNKDVESSHSLTVIIRQFEMFSNDLSGTVWSIVSAVPEARTFIVSDTIPYPPLEFEKLKESQVTVVLTKVKPDYESQFHISKLQQQIKTKFVIILPDAVKLETSELNKLMKHVETYPDDIIAGRVMGEKIKCLTAKLDFRTWTVEYKEKGKSIDVHHQLCDVLTGSPVLLVPKKLLFSLTHPFALPMPLALFLQTSFKKAKVMLANDVIFKRTKNTFENSHYIWKRNKLERERLASTYQEFGIKKVIQPDGSVDWFGCTKHSTRCFGTIINDIPDFIYEDRWTPPCCLEALRITARHVFTVLNKCGVKYWLEGGSLLGAARNGDIIPWDYDVDVGIYKHDIKKCIWLKQIDNSQKKPLIDDLGFIWERARDGWYYQVHYSLNNRLHVDIFPFYSKNGTMTKDSWFTSHRQDCEFPEKFLKPLKTIRFVGMDTSAPNNVRKFLEFKFGKGVIENPQYPRNFILNKTKYKGT